MFLCALKHAADATTTALPSRGATYFCSRLTSSLVGSLIGLREMATDFTVSVFEDLARMGSQLGVCVCACRQNLEMLRDTLRRKCVLDQWAPVARCEAGDDVCAMCMEPLSSFETVRAMRIDSDYSICLITL
jgi:hypothetical protein